MISFVEFVTMSVRLFVSTLTKIVPPTIEAVRVGEQIDEVVRVVERCQIIFPSPPVVALRMEVRGVRVQPCGNDKFRGFQS